MKALGHLVTGVGFVAVLYADLAALIHIFAEYGFGWGLVSVVVPIGWFVAPFLAGTWLIAGIGLVIMVSGAWVVDNT